MKRLLLFLSMLLILPLCAHAVTTVPAGITDVQDEAFANTAIDALILPSTVETVGANILAGGTAAYIYAQSADTVFADGASKDVPFVFAPSGSSAVYLPGYRASGNLREADGLYYFVLDTVEALCAVDPCALTGSVTIPKLVDGVPVTSLSSLYLDNTGLTELFVPQYLTIPEGMSATPYATMTATAPEADVTESPAGHYITWTTGSTGGYGEVTYLWTFEVGGETVTQLTSEPTITYAPMTEGELRVSVTAEDSIGDFATAESTAAITIAPAQPAYRALLIANTYPGATNALPGPDNDLFAMLTVLNSMTGTDYSITSAQNVTAGGMQAAIATTFAEAQPSDVSLFYYSGHGTAEGALVGTNNTLLTVYGLRTALQKIPGTKVVILDCCYSGSVINKSADSTYNGTGPSAFNSAIISALTSVSRSSENLEDAGYIVLTACRKDQTSNTVADAASSKYFGVFTYGLCYGSGYDEWKGESLGALPADADSNGAIALGEAVSGVQERIAYVCSLIPSLTQDVQYHGDASFILWSK